MWGLIVRGKALSPRSFLFFFFVLSNLQREKKKGSSPFCFERWNLLLSITGQEQKSSSSRLTKKTVFFCSFVVADDEPSSTHNVSNISCYFLLFTRQENHKKQKQNRHHRDGVKSEAIRCVEPYLYCLKEIVELPKMPNKLLVYTGVESIKQLAGYLVRTWDWY